jgi:hypothetical protein
VLRDRFQKLRAVPPHVVHRTRDRPGTQHGSTACPGIRVRYSVIGDLRCTVTRSTPRRSSTDPSGSRRDSPPPAPRRARGSRDPARPRPRLPARPRRSAAPPCAPISTRSTPALTA